jgi:peptidoglycan/xylan/chitin deacetylase (PgdA/CDA1 family)
VDHRESALNPVVPIVAVRGFQVGGGGLAALASVHALLPTLPLGPLALVGGIGTTLLLSAYFGAVFHPRTRWGVPLWVRCPSPGPVYLTFDDGPDPATTPRLLDLLAASGARATFFFVGERARRYPDLVRRTAAAGHTIGGHGQRHEAMVLLSADALAAQLAAVEATLTEALGAPLPERLLRPPHGFKTPTLCHTATRLGWTLVAWSDDPRDYDRSSPDVLAERLERALSPGAIVLLHERPGDSTLFDVLPAALAAARARGLTAAGLARR